MSRSRYRRRRDVLDDVILPHARLTDVDVGVLQVVVGIGVAGDLLVRLGVDDLLDLVVYQVVERVDAAAPSRAPWRNAGRSSNLSFNDLIGAASRAGSPDRHSSSGAEPATFIGLDRAAHGHVALVERAEPHLHRGSTEESSGDLDADETISALAACDDARVQGSHGSEGATALSADSRVWAGLRALEPESARESARRVRAARDRDRDNAPPPPRNPIARRLEEILQRQASARDDDARIAGSARARSPRPRRACRCPNREAWRPRRTVGGGVATRDSPLEKGKTAAAAFSPRFFTVHDSGARLRSRGVSTRQSSGRASQLRRRRSARRLCRGFDARRHNERRGDVRPHGARRRRDAVGTPSSTAAASAAPDGRPGGGPPSALKGAEAPLAERRARPARTGR